MKDWRPAPEWDTLRHTHVGGRELALAGGDEDEWKHAERQLHERSRPAEA
jgi:hypothetical protein